MWFDEKKSFHFISFSFHFIFISFSCHFIFISFHFISIPHSFIPSFHFFPSFIHPLIGWNHLLIHSFVCLIVCSMGHCFMFLMNHGVIRSPLHAIIHSPPVSLTPRRNFAGHSFPICSYILFKCCQKNGNSNN